MADTLEEALNETNLLGSEDDQNALVVDPINRTIKLPPNFLFGVYNDKEVNVVPFVLPRYYGDVDFSDFTISINFLNAAGYGNVYVVTDPEVTETQIKFNWITGRNVFVKEGAVRFIVCLKDVGANGEVIREFNTSVASARVITGLEVDDTPDPVAYSILSHMEELEANAASSANTAAQIANGINEAVAEAVEDAIENLDDVVTDVQVNGTSVVTNGVANIPLASDVNPGTVKVAASDGLGITNGGNLYVLYASEAQIRNGENRYKPIVPLYQHNSVFYGLAKAAGDTSQASSSNAVGAYTDDALIKIQKMLGIYQPPWELLNDITLTGESVIDLTADDNGDPYNLWGVFVRIYYGSNLANAPTGGYGRYRFEDANGQYIHTETGRYTSNAAASFKEISIERVGTMAMAMFTRVTTTGGVGSWCVKDTNGFKFNFGNIVRIYAMSTDLEPAGTRIQIYGQKM